MESDMRSLTWATVLTLVFALAGGTAMAQPRPGGGNVSGNGNNGGPKPAPAAPQGLLAQFDAQALAQLFTAAGFPSQVFDNKIDDKTTIHMVRTQFWPNDTNTFGGAYPISCQTDHPDVCQGALVFVNLGKASVDANWINAWNRSVYYVRASTNDDGSLIFSSHLMLSPGVTADWIKVSIATFKAGVDLSTDFKP
jgi:hypothetical protein